MGRGTGFRNGLTREDRLDLKGTFKRLCLPKCLPARTPGAENKEPAKPVDASRHATADAGSIPAVSIKPQQANSNRPAHQAGRLRSGLEVGAGPDVRPSGPSSLVPATLPGIMVVLRPQSRAAHLGADPEVEARTGSGADYRAGGVRPWTRR